ncbi:serine protease [Ralstonia pseudosolanacearum]|uniref:trypsin-like peptidase domain-containing protein n=1 Tax=Ralstonia pseudosolanacearum TaxID=1310165 RepID=UPI00197F66DA
MTSVRITEDNPALATLRQSWVTAVYSNEDGIGPMGSLHEAGDALAALALIDDGGPIVLGSGVMIGPGLAVVATHVLAEFKAQNAHPVLLTFLPNGARAWLPRESSTLTGPSAFGVDRRIVSDVSLLSCTLNSEAFEHYPLALAPLQIALPLVGERLWAFGYRHDALQDAAALVTPLVTSGVVTAVFPRGRGERMPSACVEVAMDTKGGMSGGPVVNANGDLVGIVSSSLDGGPSYVTLIWEALRIKVSSRLPSLALRGDIDLFAARELGLVKLKGQVKRKRLRMDALA